MLYEVITIVSFSDFIKRMNKVMHSAPAEDPAVAAPNDASASGAEVSSFFADDSASDASSGDDFSSFFGDEPAVEEEAAAIPSDSALAASAANAETLESTPNVREVIDLFNRAYARAGGGDLSAGELRNNFV